MASVKDLKKDIDMLMSLALNDCFYVIEYNSKVDAKAVMQIAEGIIEKYQEFRARVNHPDGKDNPKLIKKYYSELMSDLLAATDEALEALSTEIKKAA